MEVEVYKVDSRTFGFIPNYKFVYKIGVGNATPDEFMAHVLDMKCDEYRKTLLHKFNARYCNGYYFITKRSAQKACDWCNSIFLAQELMGDEYFEK